MSNFIEGAVFGHVTGDALGVPVEFLLREKLEIKPVTCMLANGTHKMPEGTWSDDSSMMLCTLLSIAEKKELNFYDIMSQFSKWLTEGYMTPYGKAFGIGRTTLKALSNFWRGEEAAQCGCSSEKDNGNGSLMRILPVALFNFYKLNDMPIEHKIQNIHYASALTHAHSRSCIACGIYYFIFEEIMKEQKISSVLKGLRRAEEYYRHEDEIQAFCRLFDPEFAHQKKENIKSSGYVVDTLEAVVWCLLNSASYEQTVLTAVNLGGDTDTIAAIAGSLAGILYGYKMIPEKWLNVIAEKEKIESICKQFAAAMM